MIARRQLLLVVLLTLALVAIVKMLQLALTPEAWDALALGGQRIADNLAVRLLMAGAATVFLLSLCVASWERSERRYAREAQERAERRAREPETHPLLHTPTPGLDMTRSLFPGETSSLIDDSPHGPLPDTWKAPCGELVRFPEHHTDRDPRVA